MAEKIIRTCDICEDSDMWAEDRVRFKLGKGSEREFDLCHNCLKEFMHMARNSRSVAGKRRHRAYQTRTYQDKTT